MDIKNTHDLTNLRRFDEANAPSGKLRRYAIGRTRSVLLRLFVAMVGCVFIGVFLSPHLGLLVFCVAVPLELAEHWVLKKLMRNNEFSTPDVNVRVAFASFLQVSGIGICIGLAGIQSDALRLLAWAFLLGAALNAMLTARYHPVSHRVRMMVFLATALLILSHAYLTYALSVLDFFVEFSAIFVMAGMLGYLFRHLTRREDRMRLAERALIVRSEEAAHLALVAEHASDSVIILDPDLKVTWVNNQFTGLTGFTFDEVVGLNPGVLLNHPDTSEITLQEMKAASQNGQPFNLRLLNRTKSGKTIWIETHQSPVFDKYGDISAFIAVERDVTQDVADEAELKKALSAAKAADLEKAAFLSRMSHELRTPANGLVGGLDLLGETSLNDEQTAALEILKSSTDRLMQLVENIVTVAEVDAGGVKIKIEPLQLSGLIEAVLSDHRPVANIKGLSIVTNIAKSAKGKIETDGRLLSQILDRLVDNAVKFTHAGQVTISAKIEDNFNLVISISDSGIGIAPALLNGIFEQFGQTENDTTRRFDGARLGLASAQDLVRLLGGDVIVQSKQGTGSIFTVTLPVEHRKNTENAAVKSAFPAPQALNGASETAGTPKSTVMRLLVAEDNRTNRLLIKSMLKDAGHCLEFAEDGLQAVEQYTRAPPDFVLMDLSMPNKNGLDATRDIRALETAKNLPRCPIVAVTANVSAEDRRNCFDAGMDAFLAKPLRKDSLLKTLRDVA